MHPFSSAGCRPCIRERILYVPVVYEGYERFSFPSFSALFGNARSVHMEYCSGNGEWIINKALLFPEINYVAVEKKFDRVRRIHAKRVNQKVRNLFIVCGEAQTFTNYYVPDSSIDAVYVNFPDPWPKRRHAKHRLVKAPFMKEVGRIVKPGGTVSFVSDSREYIGEVKEEIGKTDGWRSFSFVTGEEYGSSYFERLWRAKGRDIHYLAYRRVCS
ncbi:MAG: tRNA (guanosine(46)-N7)-methyltransferase TrmB [Simkaniaceae bacterium]|nr:tRNA (guanosine(46)-N7)-methyltransferase TrmB [Simkaniaceae bacterium]